MIYTLALFSATMQPEKKINAKPRTAKKDIQGKGSPKATARKH